MGLLCLSPHPTHTLALLQTAPTTLKAAFLDPVKEKMSLDVLVDVFSKSDAEFMGMFTGELNSLLHQSPSCLSLVTQPPTTPGCSPKRFGTALSPEGFSTKASRQPPKAEE